MIRREIDPVTGIGTTGTDFCFNELDVENCLTGGVPRSKHPDKVFWIQSPERLVLQPEHGDAVIRGPRNHCDDNTRASSWCHTEDDRRPASWPQITRVILIHG